MSLSVPRDTPTTPPQAPLVDAPQGSAQVPVAPVLIPFRAQLSLFRQRIILTIRWWFRLEIDDVKERNTQDQIDGLVELNQRANEAMKSFLRLNRRLEERLQLYEREIPRMRELRRQYDLEQQGIIAKAHQTLEARDSGILALPARNGKIIHP